MTIRWRLTLFHTATILAIAAGLLVILFAVLLRSVPATVEATARGRAYEAAWLLREGRAPDDPLLARLGDDDVYLIVRDGDGVPLTAAGEPVQWFDRVNDAARDALWRETIGEGTPQDLDDDGSAQLYAYAVPVVGSPSGARVAEAWMSYDAQANVLVPLLSTLTVGIPVAVLIAVAGSYLLARSAMAPVDAIVRAARDISGSDLSRRLPVRRPNDELGRLATTFNDVLGRLDGAFRQRQAALDAQRRFVADASHELRTPLTSIAGYARMLREWAHDDPATARESAAAIEREAARMALLVEDLLLLARGDEAMIDTGERTRQDVVGVVEDAVGAARIVVAGRVPILFERPPEPVLAAIDRRQIHQIVAILLDNAVKYTPIGNEGPITVAIRTPPGQVAIDVADSGPGIPADQMPRIFERFYRGDVARSGGGTGLGLSIARQLAGQHGGTIAVASPPGGGPVFTVTLPATATATATGEAAGAPEGSAL